MKFKRLENNMGTITKLKGNLRKPFRIQSPLVYIAEEKKFKRITIGYAKTYKEAEILLWNFNQKKINLNNLSNCNFKVLFDYFLKEKESVISKQFYNSYKNIIENKLYSLFKMKIVDVNYLQLQNIIDNCSYSSGRLIILILKFVYLEALKRDITNKDLSVFLKAKNKKEKRTKTIITKEEIDLLWKVLDKEFKVASVLLIQLYTGCRISEVLSIKIENIHLEDRYFVGGMKTSNGKNRIIPIHKKIIPIFQKLLSNNLNTVGNLFVTNRNTNSDFNNLKPYFKAFKEKYNFNHTTHEARHTFISRMQTLELSTIKLKKIVGHSTNDITESVYTHFSIETLIEIIDKFYY